MFCGCLLILFEQQFLVRFIQNYELRSDFDYFRHWDVRMFCYRDEKGELTWQPHVNWVAKIILFHWVFSRYWEITNMSHSLYLKLITESRCGVPSKWADHSLVVVEDVHHLFTFSTSDNRRWQLVRVVFVEYSWLFLIEEAESLRRVADQHVFTVKDQLQPSLFCFYFTRQIETTIFSISNFDCKCGVLWL